MKETGQCLKERMTLLVQEFITYLNALRPFLQATTAHSADTFISFSTKVLTAQSYLFSEMENALKEPNGHLKNVDFFWKGMPSSVCRAPFIFALSARNRKKNLLKMLVLLRSSRQTFSSSLYGKRLQHMELYHQTTTNAKLLLFSFIRHQFQITNRIVLETVKCKTTWMNPSLISDA